MYYGAKIYYDALTGNVLQVTQPAAGESYVPPTKEQDMQTYENLIGRIPATVSHITLAWPYGSYAEDFSEGYPVKVDIWTKKIYFQKNGTNPSTPAPEPELALTDRIGNAEAALGASVISSALNAMLIYELSTDADATVLTVADLQARYAETALKLAETEVTVEVLKETMTALIAEIAELKSQSGSGEGNGG